MAREERRRRGPVEGRLERQPHRQAPVRGQPVSPPPAGPQLAGRRQEDLAHLPVELTQAGEPRRERHVAHGHVGVVEQPPGEVRPPRHGQLARSDAQVVVEDPPQVPGRDREPGPERRLGPGVQHSLDDQLDRTAHQLGRIRSEGARGPVRTAAQAGPEPRRFRARGQLERPHVLGPGPRAAAGPAVDAGGHHRRVRRHSFGIGAAGHPS